MAQCFTQWFLETEEYVVLACDQCDQPIVVHRGHAMDVDAAKLRDALKQLESEKDAELAQKDAALQDIKAKEEVLHRGWSILYTSIGIV